jgi:hypothetical protein
MDSRVRSSQWGSWLPEDAEATAVRQRVVEVDPGLCRCYYARDEEAGFGGERNARPDDWIEVAANLGAVPSFYFVRCSFMAAALYCNSYQWEADRSNT